MQGQESKDERLTLLAQDIDTLLSLIYADERHDEEVRKIAEEAKMAAFMLSEKLWDIYKEIQWRAEMLIMCCGKRNRDLCRGHINVLREHFMMGGDEIEREIDDDNIIVTVSALYWVKKIRAAVDELMELFRGRDAHTREILQAIVEKLGQIEREIKRIHSLLGGLAEDVYNKLNRRNAAQYARRLKAIAELVA